MTFEQIKVLLHYLPTPEAVLECLETNNNTGILNNPIRLNMCLLNLAILYKKEKAIRRIFEHYNVPTDMNLKEKLAYLELMGSNE